VCADRLACSPDFVIGYFDDAGACEWLIVQDLLHLTPIAARKYGRCPFITSEGSCSQNFSCSHLLAHIVHVRLSEFFLLFFVWSRHKQHQRSFMTLHAARNILRLRENDGCN